MVLARTSDGIPFRAPRRSGEGPWIAAHRGHSARFPENTIAAFEGAVAAGADLIETDIQRARDGVFVCLHDPDLGRLAGNTAKVADLDAADLDAILGRRTAGGVPRLSQVLEFARGRVGLLLDLKSTEARFVGAVARAVRDAGVSAWAVVGVRSLDALAALRRIDGEVAALAFFSDITELPAFFAAGGDVARLWQGDASAEAVRRLRGGGKPVWVMAGDPRLGRVGDLGRDDAEALLRMGIDGLILNDPSLGIAARRAVFLQQYGGIR